VLALVALVVALIFVTSVVVQAQTVKFNVGDRFPTTAKLNVRATPNGRRVGSQNLGVKGSVVAGPQYVKGYYWYQINYDTGVDGWSVQDYLQSLSTPTPIPVPTTPPAPTLSLAALPASITSGTNSTLTWATTNATSCTAAGGWSGTQSTSGTTTITPTTTTTYSLTCTGTGGTVTQSVSVSVSTTTTPPPTTSGTVVHNATELDAALKAAAGVGGVTLLLAPGNYGDVAIGAWNVGYTFPSPVTITSQDPTNRAVFHTIFIQNNSGITIANVNVVGVGVSYAVQMYNNSNITLGGMKITGPNKTGVGIFSRSDSNITMTNNDIGNYGVGISAYQDFGSLAITRNNVHDVENDGIDVYDGAGLVFAPNVSENYVHDFSPVDGDHPDGIQFAAFGGTVTPTVKDNLVTRGFNYSGALPPQGIFISDGPLYSNPVVTGNLSVGTLYNGITIGDSTGGTMSNNTVLSFPDYCSRMRYENTAGLTVSNNLACLTITTTVNTNLTLSNNTNGGAVADMTAAQPAINTWRASHPNVPTDSFQPVLALTAPNGTVAGAFVDALARLKNLVALESQVKAVLAQIASLKNELEAAVATH
jgi:hypothetical protein